MPPVPRFLGAKKRQGKFWSAGETMGNPTSNAIEGVKESLGVGICLVHTGHHIEGSGQEPVEPRGR